MVRRWIYGSDIFRDQGHQQEIINVSSRQPVFIVLVGSWTLCVYPVLPELMGGSSSGCLFACKTRRVTFLSFSPSSSFVLVFADCCSAFRHSRLSSSSSSSLQPLTKTLRIKPLSSRPIPPIFSFTSLPHLLPPHHLHFILSSVILYLFFNLFIVPLLLLILPSSICLH